jgi:DNA polymerase III epsilon subunit-like protein
MYIVIQVEDWIVVLLISFRHKDSTVIAFLAKFDLNSLLYDSKHLKGTTLNKVLSKNFLSTSTLSEYERIEANARSYTVVKLVLSVIEGVAVNCEM